MSAVAALRCIHQVPKNKLTLAVLDLSLLLLKFGAFQSVGSLFDIARPMIDLLDGTVDIPDLHEAVRCRARAAVCAACRRFPCLS
jgi:hypothetical protein